MKLILTGPFTLSDFLPDDRVYSAHHHRFFTVVTHARKNPKVTATDKSNRHEAQPWPLPIEWITKIERELP